MTNHPGLPSDGAAAHAERARLTRLSKRLSLVLRHDPASIDLQLDPGGWVGLADLVRALGAHGHPATQADIERVVQTSDKRRFAIEAGRIRANQGHSLPIELGLTAVEPPACLYHGTVERFLAAIEREGLVRGGRQFVHLSVDRETAERVGARRGKPVVLVIDAAGLHRAGAPFFRAENGVWLVKGVPRQYVSRAPTRAGDVAI